MRAIAALLLLSTTSTTLGCELFLTSRDDLVGRDGGGADSALLDGSTIDGATSDGGTCDADLTRDENNCGACGHGCCEGKCVASACVPVQLGSGGEPIRLTLDDTSIYWLDRSDGKIRTRPKSQIGQEKVLHTGTPGTDLGQIAVDGAFVYFTTPTAVMRAPTTPGTATTVLGGLTGASCAATYGGYVYYATSSGVRRVHFDGSGDEPIATLTNAGPRLVVAAPSIYLTPKMVRAPLLGGAVQGPGFDTESVAATATDAFALEILPNTHVGIVHLDDATLTPTTITEVPNDADGIAFDGAHVWIGDHGASVATGSIVRYDLDGKNRTVIASGQSRPSGLVADAQCLYWTNPINDGRLMKIAK
jgi:hypothetical protein